MIAYKIVRKYFKEHPDEIIATGLTLEEAQTHCRDPETSSKTCSTLEGLELLRKFGPWFDCYDEDSSKGKTK